jgi:hypothetical protein
MSIFGSIVNKIFGHAAASPSPASQTSSPTAGASPSSATPVSFNNPSPAPHAPGSTSSSPADTSPQASSSATVSPQPANTNVDVAAILTDLASKNPQKLDWRHSIVDLMKLLGLDSSLSARQELAKELHYSGSTEDSATMNVWLHKQVMQKLAENGGKVPDDLK